MSAESFPVLAGAIPALEIFMTAWEEMGDKHPHLKPFLDEGLKFAKKYYRRMDRSRAYTIAMCECPHCYQDTPGFFLLIVLNPCIRLTWIKKHWGDDYLHGAEDMLKALVSLIATRGAPHLLNH
jgi:hypothetical protein